MSLGLSLARSFGGRDPHELAGQGSNLQPPDPKSGVLPIELPAIALALPRYRAPRFGVALVRIVRAHYAALPHGIFD